MTLDSGHSDQQDAKSDMGEEDGLDESAFFFPSIDPCLMPTRTVLIASDEQPVIDNVSPAHFISTAHVH